MPPKKQTERLTDAQIKAASSLRNGAAAHDQTQANIVVQALVEALPDRKGTECNRLRHLILEPGGKVTVWDQLGKRREDYGPQAGLVALVGMLGANQDQFVAQGQEPASAVLASMVTQNSRALQLSKQKFLLKRLMGIVGDHRCNENTRKSTSWVLRRVCEVSAPMRIELGSDRLMMQMLGRIMRCEPLDEAASAGRHGIPDGNSSRSFSRASSRAGGGRASSGSGFGSSGLFGPRTPMPVGQENILEDQSWNAKSADSSFRSFSGFSRTASKGSPLKGLTSSQDMNGSFMSMRLPSSKGTGGDRGEVRPGTADSNVKFFRGVSRPGTGFGTTLIRDNDSMCVQGNCCCVIGNLCYSDEVIERVAKTDGVVSGLLFMLEYGTEWAAGHAARALGNLTYSMENAKALVDLDPSNIAVRNLSDMIAHPDTQQRTKELAIFSIANLTRREEACHRLSGVPGIYRILGDLGTKGIARDDVDRAICNMSQARLGTKTWRQPKRL